MFAYHDIHKTLVLKTDFLQGSQTPLEKNNIVFSNTMVLPQYYKGVWFIETMEQCLIQPFYFILVTKLSNTKTKTLF